MRLKIITLNCFGVPTAVSGRRVRFKLIAKAIKKSRPQLVLLQEVILAKDRQILERALSDDYYFYPRHQEFLHGGLLILSRWPAVSYKFAKYQTRGPLGLWSLTDRLLHKGFQIIKIYPHQSQCQPLLVANTHLLANYHDSPKEQRAINRQIKQLDDSLTKQSQGKIILGGDLNFAPHTSTYKYLITKHHFVDPLKNSRQVTVGVNKLNKRLLSLFVKTPSHRTDYILFKRFKKLAVKEKVIFKQPVKYRGKKYNLSDHYGVMAEVGG